MFTSPVVMTWPLSTWVTRVIGTKIDRRPNTSTTSPSTRGGSSPGRSTTTRSRTLPTWSPAGSNTDRPARRAAKTREGEVLTSAQVSRCENRHHATALRHRRRVHRPAVRRQPARRRPRRRRPDHRAVPGPRAGVRLLRVHVPCVVGDGGLRVLHPHLHAVLGDPV